MTFQYQTTIACSFGNIHGTIFRVRVDDVVVAYCYRAITEETTATSLTVHFLLKRRGGGKIIFRTFSRYEF